MQESDICRYKVVLLFGPCPVHGHVREKVHVAEEETCEVEDQKTENFAQPENFKVQMAVH